MTKEQREWINLCRMLGLDDEEFEAYFLSFILPNQRKKEEEQYDRTTV